MSPRAKTVGVWQFSVVGTLSKGFVTPGGPTAAHLPCISLWLDAMRVVDHCGLRLGFKPTVQGPLASSPDGFPFAVLALPLQPGAGRACHSVEPLAHTSSLGNSLKPQQGGTAEARRGRWVKPTAAAHAHRKCAGAGIQWRGLGSGQCLGRLWVGGGTRASGIIREDATGRRARPPARRRGAGARAGWQQQQQQQGGRASPHSATAVGGRSVGLSIATMARLPGQKGGRKAARAKR